MTNTSKNSSTAISFEAFVASRKKVESIGAEVGLSEMNETAGYVYEDCCYIEQCDDEFLLVVANQDWMDSDLSKLERILYDVWYVPQNS